MIKKKIRYGKGYDVIRARDVTAIATQAIVVLIITKMFFFP
jgi:hypothetical protein